MMTRIGKKKRRRIDFLAVFVSQNISRGGFYFEVGVTVQPDV